MLGGWLLEAFQSLSLYQICIEFLFHTIIVDEVQNINDEYNDKESDSEDLDDEDLENEGLDSI